MTPAFPMTGLVPSEEKRRVFYDHVRKAWDEYQATGLHVTGEEVAAWLETWGTDDNKASPVCHSSIRAIRHGRETGYD